MVIQSFPPTLAQIPAFQTLSSQVRTEIVRTMQLEQITKQTPLVLRVPPETHYLLPLSDNLTLHRGQRFGMRLPLGVLWPVTLARDDERQVRCMPFDRELPQAGWLAVLAPKTVNHLLTTSAETRISILQAILQSNQYVTNELEQYACNDLTGRVASLLLDLHRASKRGIIYYAHSQLAQLLNVQRETVSVIIGRFRRAGWVVTNYGRIEVTDCASLTRIAHGY